MINPKMRYTLSGLMLVLIVASSDVLPANCPVNDPVGSDELHITGRIHFNINASNFERSREFYRAAGFVDQVGGFPETNTIQVSRGLGLDALYRIKAELIYLGKLPSEPIDLTVPTGRFVDLIEWMEPTRSDPPYAEINHLGITYFSLTTDNLAGLLPQLAAAGGTVEVERVVDSSGTQLAMVRDPDGIFIEVRQSSESAPRIDHLNINVSDLECAEKFYAMLGLESAEQRVVHDGDALFAAMGVGPDIRRKETMLQHRFDGSKIKLNQWLQPVSTGEPYPPPINHLGLHRINWASTDLAADVSLLKSRGVNFLSDIVPCCEGDASTFGFILFEDPDGNFNQLMGSITPHTGGQGGAAEPASNATD